MSLAIRLAQTALVATAVFCALVIDLRAMLPSVVLDGRYVGDFTVFWTAARVDSEVIYDLEAISQAQAPVLGGPKGARPFVNPPSFLPWLEPFGRLPLHPALALWTLLGLAAFGCASRRLVEWRHALLIAIAPPFVLAFAAGQVAYFVAAAAIAGILQLRSRPILAGVLFGLAATIKPQIVVLTPLALMAGAHWRALAAAALTGLAIGGACVLLQGPQLWLDWLQALEGFSEIAQRSYLMKRGATPTNLAYLLGLAGVGADVLIWGLRAFGIAVVVAVFRGSEDEVDRIAALFAGSLLCVPYAMPPEAVPLLIPAAIWLLGRDKRWWFPGFLMISQLLLPVGVLAMAVAALWRSMAWRRDDEVDASPRAAPASAN